MATSVGQRISSIFRKAVFGTVAVVGITAAYHYGTRRDMVVKIVQPAGADSTASSIVYTDGGNFANDPTFWYRKDEAVTAEMAAMLKNAEYAKITVYGISPNFIGGGLLNSMRFYRNIAHVELSSEGAYRIYQAEQLAKANKDAKEDSKPVAVDSSNVRVAAEDSAREKAQADSILAAEAQKEAAAKVDTVATDSTKKVKKPEPQP